MNIWARLLITLTLSLLLFACGSAAPPSNTPVSSPTVLPTSTVEPTAAQVPVEPQTVTVTPIKDNTLYETATGHLSNGSGQHFFAGKSAAGPLRRAVIAFDLAGAVPQGATITDAELSLSLSRTMAAEQVVTVHRLLADWGEGTSDSPSNEGSGVAAATDDATWTHRFFESQLWEVPGGDFVATPSGSQVVALPERYTWDSTEEMVADVQVWLDNPQQNFGWLLQGNEDELRTTKRFDSRENETPENRPALTVTFIPP